MQKCQLVQPHQSALLQSFDCLLLNVGAEQIGDTIDVMFSYISGDTDSGGGYRCRVQMAFPKSGAPRPPD